MTPTEFFRLRPSVGTAVWLFEFLAWHTKVIPEAWMPVGNGSPFTDEYLAYQLDVTAATIRRWRMKLEKHGYLGTELVRPRYRKMWIPNLTTVSRQLTLQETPVSSVVN